MTEYNFHQGFERLANAWSGKGDRPPVFAQLHEFALRQSGESGKKFYYMKKWAKISIFRSKTTKITLI